MFDLFGFWLATLILKLLLEVYPRFADGIFVRMHSVLKGQHGQWRRQNTLNVLSRSSILHYPVMMAFTTTIARVQSRAVPSRFSDDMCSTFCRVEPHRSYRVTEAGPELWAACENAAQEDEIVQMPDMVIALYQRETRARLDNGRQESDFSMRRVADS